MCGIIFFFYVFVKSAVEFSDKVTTQHSLVQINEFIEKKKRSKQMQIQNTYITVQSSSHHHDDKKDMFGLIFFFL